MGSGLFFLGGFLGSGFFGFPAEAAAAVPPPLSLRAGAVGLTAAPPGGRGPAGRASRGGGRGPGGGDALSIPRAVTGLPGGGRGDEVWSPTMGRLGLDGGRGEAGSTVGRLGLEGGRGEAGRLVADAEGDSGSVRVLEVGEPDLRVASSAT